MLYDRWREIASAHRNELALRDLASGRRWTFGELLAWSDGCETPSAPIVFPQGNSGDFVLELLRAWRHGRAACPLEAGQSAPEIPAPPPNVAHLKRTSATTGPARYVAFTAEQLAADPANIVSTMGLRPDWPNLGAISLAHSYGFSNLVLPLLLRGIPLILAESALPEAVRHGLATGPVTLPGVPALWRAWHEAGALSPNIKLAISAGAPLPLALEQRVYSEMGLKIHNFLGSTECGGIAYDRAETPRDDAALAGSAMNNVQIAAEDGLLTVRSAAVGETYWPEPDTRLGNGIFRAADIVELRGGQLFIRGRASDVMQIAGRKVAPEEIERALLKHPAVRECLVFDAPRGEENQIIAALVGDRTKLAELQSALAAELPAWQWPRQWRFVESLGENARGKVSRAEWRRKFLAGEI